MSEGAARLGTNVQVGSQGIWSSMSRSVFWEHSDILAHKDGEEGGRGPERSFSKGSKERPRAVRWGPG